MPLRPRRLSVAALAAIGIALATAPAADAITMTRELLPTNAAQAVDVPPSVTSIDVVAVGGRGGGGYGPPEGGFGGHVSGELTVTPGSRLWVLVGGNGAASCPTGSWSGSPAGGGWNGGAEGGSGACSVRGGSGGGASDVRVCDPAVPCPDDPDPDADPLGRLIVAGGGGGAGRWANDSAGFGGDAGAAGGTVSNVRGTGGGGGGGTISAGGAAGVSGEQGTPWEPIPPGAGTLGAGGIGGTGIVGAITGGGGGGGGLYGGGGGGSANYYAGGGGGGSNLVPAGGSAVTDTTGSPRVTLSWEAGAPATIDRPTLAEASIYADGVATTTVTAVVRDADGIPVRGAEVTFSASAPQPQFGPVTDHEDGRYSATVTAASSRGTTQITARLVDADRTSEPATLTQVERPVVTSPSHGTPLIERAGETTTIDVSGTADPLTTAVDVSCLTNHGVPRLGGATNVPVVDGRWSVSDATLPSVGADGPQCRLVVVAHGETVTRATAPPGPRLRRLEITEWQPRGSTVAAWTIAGGLDGEARLTSLGSGCGVSLEQVRPDLTTSIFWLSCGASLDAYSPSIDGEPTLLVDGKRAYTAALLESLSGGAGELPPLTIDATTTADGSFLITERSPTRRCTLTEDRPASGAACGPLADTGVEIVVRTRVAPSGATVRRTIDFESTDDRPHEARITLESSTYYLLNPEVRVGDESSWRPAPTGERSSDLGAAHSVLFRRAGTNTVPATAITAVPGPTTQVHERLALAQRFLRSVPAGGAAGVALTFDLVGRDDAEAAAAAARTGYDVAVAIDPPASGATTAESVTLTGTASDQAGPVQLRVADQRVAVDGEGRWTTTVPLSLGENPIEAVVESRYGPQQTATVTVTRTAPPADPDPPTGPVEPTPPTGPEGPNPPVGPTPPAGPGDPAPPGGTNPPTRSQPLRRASVPKRVRIAQVRRRGLAIPLTLSNPRTRITAELRGPWGAFARTTTTTANGRTTLRLKPSPRTLARASAALRRSKTVRLRLKLTVRDASGATQTVIRTIQLRR